MRLSTLFSSYFDANSLFFHIIANRIRTKRPHFPDIRSVICPAFRLKLTQFVPTELRTQRVRNLRIGKKTNLPNSYVR